MNISEGFVRRPVATTLFTCGIVLAGATAFVNLPVSPLPQVDLPTIQVSAQMAGASPETMAQTVATPLERHLGTIADVTEMTSSSSTGNTGITLQFGIHRDIDGAARDVQAAINAARADLPTALRSNPTYRKANPADAPIIILTLTSSTLTQGQLYDAASTVLQQKLLQVVGSRRRPDRRELASGRPGGDETPRRCSSTAWASRTCGRRSPRPTRTAPRAPSRNGTLHWQIYDNDQSPLGPPTTTI